MKSPVSVPDIVLADEFLLAVDKPPGIAVIPEAYRDAPCVVRMLEEKWGRLWVVHRIDRDTSGVVLLARTAEAHRSLNEQFSRHMVRKVYHLLVRGSPSWDEVLIDARLRPDGDARHRTVVDPAGGRRAETTFRVLTRFTCHCLIEALPRTGRTHQIRVHAAWAGHPVVGDGLYGDGKPLRLSSLKPGYKGDPATERPLMERTALHAYSLEVSHPATGVPLMLSCPYRRDMRAAIAQLERCSRR